MTLSLLFGLAAGYIAVCVIRLEVTQEEAKGLRAEISGLRDLIAEKDAGKKEAKEAAEKSAVPPVVKPVKHTPKA